MAHLLESWPALRDHAEQSRLWWSSRRHRALAAGRGAGKTENAARILIAGDEHHRGALCPDPNVVDPLYVVAAPTRDQVKRIWWTKLKRMVPWEVQRCEPLEGELTIVLRNGARIQLVGLDKPQRTEGVAIDGLVVDEYAEVKAAAWGSSLEPALNRVGRSGWGLLVGRPKGRNHFYERWRNAKMSAEWASFHWTSREVLEPERLAAIEADCDPLTFKQEYLADWVNFEGLAYYGWDPNVHLRQLKYWPDLPLVFSFDFNRDPGVAVIIQEQTVQPDARLGLKEPTNVTCVIGEVHIRNSNTPAVCRKLCEHWGHHKGTVFFYGDASGNSTHTTSLEGNDWDIVKDHLKGTFRDLRDRVQRSNPRERDRVNSVNSRLKNAAGQVRVLVDPIAAPHVVKDFEGVTVLEGGSGELDKKRDLVLTHLTDAFGYYIHEKHPLGGHTMVTH